MPTLEDLTAALRGFALTELGFAQRSRRGRSKEPSQGSCLILAERDWQQFHDPKNLAMLVASEAGELLAEYRWVRNEDADAHSREPKPRARIAAEVADVGIALLLLCDRIGLDLADAIGLKLAANAKRYPVERSRGRAERPE